MEPKNHKLLAAIALLVLAASGQLNVPLQDAKAVPGGLDGPIPAFPGAPLDCIPVFHPGIGNACEEEGLLSLWAPDGTPLGTIEEPHPMPWDEAGSHLTASMSATRSPYCIMPGEPYYTTVIYARPFDRPDNHAARVPLLRDIVDRANAKLNDAATGGTADIRFLCAGGQVVVHNEVLPTASTSSDFGTIVSDLIAKGYNNPKVRYAVFYDYYASGFPGGTGHIRPDSSAGAWNWNNGNTFSMTYSATFLWPISVEDLAGTLLHEWTHNSGGVQLDAPHATGWSGTNGYHCWDGTDIMCYNDGAPNGHLYSTAHCSGYPYDCNKDDFFNTQPALGSYLATKWNVGHPWHRYIYWGNHPCTYTSGSVPVAPSPVWKTGTTTPTIHWNRFPAGSCAAETYEVLRGTTNPPTTVIANLVPTVATVQSYTDTAVLPCGTLYYAVRARNVVGPGPLSTAVSHPGSNACDRTWAAGGRLGDHLVAAGDDFGCGLGRPATGTPSPTDVVGWDTGPGPSRGAMTFLPDLPAPRGLMGGESTGTDHDSRLYVLGGTDSCAFTPKLTVWRLDKGASGWQTMASMNVARIEPAVASSAFTGDDFNGTLLSPDYLFVAGGDTTGGDPHDPANRHRPTAAFEVYSEWFNNWFMNTPMVAGVTGADGAFRVGEKQFVVGGGAGHPQVPNQFIQVYEWGSGWLGDHLPDFRAAHGATVCGGEAVVVGGVLGEQRDIYSSAGATDSVVWGMGGWQSAPDLPQSRSHMDPVTLPDGTTMIVHGGYTGGGVPTSTTYFATCAPALGPGAWTTRPVVGDPAPAIAEYVAGEFRPVRPDLQTRCSTPEPCLPTKSAVPEVVFVGGVNATSSGCPSAEIHVLGREVAAGTPSMWESYPPASGMTPVASAGGGMLPNGMMVVVGGREEGSDDNGDPSCRIPSRQAGLLYPEYARYSEANGMPARYKWLPLPDLPEGLIAPTVAIDGYRVYVTGGDETGERPVPTTALDDRPYRPSRETYVIELSALERVPLPSALEPDCDGTIVPQEVSDVCEEADCDDLVSRDLPWPCGEVDEPVWERRDDLPLPVAFGDGVVVDREFRVIGGHHHPQVATRAVQTFQLPQTPSTGTESPVVVSHPAAPSVDETWTDPRMPAAAMHHRITSGGGLCGGIGIGGALYHDVPSTIRGYAFQVGTEHGQTTSNGYSGDEGGFTGSTGFKHRNEKLSFTNC